MDSLRTNARTFTAPSAASGNVEGTNDMIQLLLHLVRIRLAGNRSVRLIKNTLLTAARRADIAAGIAADALRQLALPEGKALLRAHRFKLLDLGELIAGKLWHRQRLAQLLVRNFISSALAHHALVQQHVSLRQALFTIGSAHNNLVAVHAHADNALSSGSLNLFDIQHTAARRTDCINKLTLNAVILEQLVHAIGIAGLQENSRLLACMTCFN